MKGKVPALVTCQWLKQCLNAARKDFRLLDATWAWAKNSGKTEFISKHIPGAIFFDQNRCVNPTRTIVRTLPNPECHEDHMRSLGVSADSHLVVYARGDLLSAARAWWTIRAMGHPYVSLLNGCFEQWESEVGDVESGDASYSGPKGDVKVKMNHRIITSFKDITDMAQKGGCQIVDTRLEDNFLGISPEPSDFTKTAMKSVDFPLPEKIHQGHVPGAVNMHVSLFKTPSHPGMLKTKEELKEVFEKGGINLQRPLTFMCYNGLNACVPTLAAAVLGKDDAAVYYGSWTEYGQLADPSMCISGPKIHGV